MKFKLFVLALSVVFVSDPIRAAVEELAVVQEIPEAPQQLQLTSTTADTGARDAFKALMLTELGDMPDFDDAPEKKQPKILETSAPEKPEPKKAKKKARLQVKLARAEKESKGTIKKIRPSSVLSSKSSRELDFDVLNKTGKTVYVTCFAYLRRRDFARWGWYKSPVYVLKNNSTQTIDINSIENEQDRKNVFGYLGVFPSYEQAEKATYELTEDRFKLDLDKLIALKNKTVTLHVETYGFKGEFVEYDFEKNDQKEQVASTRELDFAVENKTGVPLYVCGFIYMKKAKGSWLGATEDKDDMAVWRFDKTPIIRVEPNQVGVIDVDTIVTQRDQSYVRGYLGIFGESELELAKAATYELLDNTRKMNLGPLRALGGKKVVLEVESYGILEKPDFVVKPIRKIDFTKI